MHYPVVIFAFDRIDYFEALLQSLTQQSGTGITGREVHLFQDGAICAWTQQAVAAPETIAQSLDLFRRYIPHGQVHFDNVNRGIAIQWHRAEEFIFGQRDAPAAYMLEDDTILGPHYMAMLDPLSERAIRHGRISYVSAFGDHRISVEDQAADRHAMLPMDHTWAAVMLRNYWHKERELIRPYYELMARQPYRSRPHGAILRLLTQTLGGGRGTAQDAAKESASLALGYARLRTKVCQAKYIGDRGVHFNRTLYEQYGFDRTVLFPDAVFDLELPQGEALDRLIDGEKRLVTRDTHRNALRHPELFAELAQPNRLQLASGDWLVSGEPGNPLTTTADPTQASMLSVLSWVDDTQTLLALKDEQGRWIGASENATLIVLPTGAAPSYLFRIPTTDDRFYLVTHQSRAMALHSAPSVPGLLRATASHYSNATALALHRVG